MKDLWGNLGYVLDSTLLRDAMVDFAKLDYVAVVRINLDRSTERLFDA